MMNKLSDNIIQGGSALLEEGQYDDRIQEMIEDGQFDGIIRTRLHILFCDAYTNWLFYSNHSRTIGEIMSYEGKMSAYNEIMSRLEDEEIK